MTIRENIAVVRQSLPKEVTLLCVSKYHTVDEIAEAYACGERLFGESRVQELLAKQKALPKDIQWHFIGHVQTNKLRQLLPMVSLIHGVDSFRLLEAIDKEAEKLALSAPVRVLLEVKVAQEETKYGFTEEGLRKLLAQEAWKKLTHVQIEGIMGMASQTDDARQIGQEFSRLSAIFKAVAPHLADCYGITPILSMGMSEDYQLALPFGTTLVRIGSRIFG